MNNTGGKHQNTELQEYAFLKCNADLISSIKHVSTSNFLAQQSAKHEWAT